MAEEFHALLKNGTWTLVPPQPSMNIVGCKWVFRTKRKFDGSIDRYKAWLVAKGIHQQFGIDYTETYSPVIKPITIRTVLSFVVSYRWPIKQIDVSNAFFAWFLVWTSLSIRSTPRKFVSSKRLSMASNRTLVHGSLGSAPTFWNLVSLPPRLIALCSYSNLLMSSSWFLYM